MGTDIHFAVERREPTGWALEVGEDAGWYDDRNYCVFAMLADVRNVQGFAGCDTGDPVVPIAEPRGFPGDASPELQKWWADKGEHTPSWLTARELVEVDWRGNKIVSRGIVDPENFYRWRRWGKPDSWSGGVSGPGVRHISIGDMQSKIDLLEVSTPWTERQYVEKHGQQPPDRWSPGSVAYYTQVEWTESWADVIGSFAQTVLAMVRVASLHCLSLDDVRAVFYFDS